MSTTTGNPLAVNGENQFDQQRQYGDVARQAALAHDAPISGSPVPGTPTTAAPAVAGGQPAAPAGPLASGFAPSQPANDYKRDLAVKWKALALMPGSSPLVKSIAKLAIESARQP